MSTPLNFFSKTEISSVIKYSLRIKGFEEEHPHCKIKAKTMLEPN